MQSKTRTLLSQILLLLNAAMYIQEGVRTKTLINLLINQQNVEHCDMQSYN